MIIVMGSVNADLVSFMSRFPEVGETIMGTGFALFQGGKGANQAVGVAKLGEKVKFFGMVGNDTFGSFLLKSLREAGVDVSKVKKVNDESGVASIWVSEDGENSIVLNPGANAHLNAEAIRSSESLFSSADYLLIQLETPLSGVVEASRIAKKNGVKVILDPAPAIKLPTELLKNVDYITPNEVEIGAISEGKDLISQIEWLESQGPRVLVKAGSKGVYLLSGKNIKKMKAFHVKAVDTTGAGDCFNAAFATALSRNFKFEDACKFAMAAAAISVTRKGAAISFPTRKEVDEFLKGWSGFEA